MTSETLIGTKPELWAFWLLQGAAAVGFVWLVLLGCDYSAHRWHRYAARRQMARERAELECQRQLKLVAHLRPRIHYVGTVEPQVPLTLLRTQFAANQTDPRRNGG